MAVASVVVLGAVMSILDVTVVNVAINTLAREFDTTLPTIQWIATGYTLALATVIPVTGWAADRFGTKRLYLLSLGLFMGGSALSGLAWSAESLIAFRVLQGLGGGMLMPLGMTILTRAAGPQRVGRVMSIIGVPMLLGPILGPILGGWLVDDVSWRWIFFINIPIGIVALTLATRILPRDTPAPQHGFDALGLALLSPGLALVIYGLAESASSGGFGAPEVLIPALVGAALLVGFVVHALRVSEPLIDLGLFRNRTFAAASGMLVLFAIAVFGTMLLLPIYLQAVRGESALTSGLLLAPQGIGAMLTMPIAGQLADRTGIGRIVLVGMVLILGATLALTQIARGHVVLDAQRRAVRARHGHGLDDDADHDRRAADAAQGGDRAGQHDAQHPPAGRRVDRHRRDDRRPHERARRPPADAGRHGGRVRPHVLVGAGAARRRVHRRLPPPAHEARARARGRGRDGGAPGDCAHPRLRGNPPRPDAAGLRHPAAGPALPAPAGRRSFRAAFALAFMREVPLGAKSGIELARERAAATAQPPRTRRSGRAVRRLT